MVRLEKTTYCIIKHAGLYFLLNSILFLPFYLLSLQSSSFFPNFNGVENGNIYSYFKLLFIRENQDLFRISLDFFCLTLLVSFLSKMFNWRGGYVILWVVYMLFLIYQIYSAVFQGIYGTIPMFYNDWSTLKTGFMIVYQGVSLKFLAAIFGVILLLFFFLRAIKVLLKLSDAIRNTLYAKVVVSAVVLCLLVNLKFWTKIDSKNTFQYQSLSIIKNIQHSSQASLSLLNFSAEQLVNENKYSLGELTSKPDLYFISIESYGKIWLTHDSLKEKSLVSLVNFKNELQSEEWNITSNYSLSPVTGGLSWIAYSNFSFGLNFKNQGTYNALLDERGIDEFSDLFNVFKKQGYTNYRLVPLFKSGKIVIPWEKYKNFYRVDEWIKYEDLDYRGELYGFGPAVPDQYALHYAKEVMDKKVGPKTLFFLTVSSHNPFITPDYKNNWKELNNSTRSSIDGANLLVKPTFSNYHKAIDYELKILSNFIRSTGDSNAIYVLFGDHQPPFLTKKANSFETPIHIISKNVELVKTFTEYGFKTGSVPTEGNPIKHEGFLSMFLREFKRAFEISGGNDQKYLPDGIDIN